MSLLVRRWTCVLLVWLLAGLPLAAAADSSVQELVAKTLTVAAGDTTTFEIGVTSSDTTIWSAGSYTVQLIATDPTGAVVASTDPTPGDDSAIPGQTTFIFLGLPIPGGYAGALNVVARVRHGRTVDDSVTVGIVAGAGTQVAAASPVPAPPPGQPPAAGATPVPGPQAIPGQPGVPGQAAPAPAASAAASPAESPAGSPAPTETAAPTPAPSSSPKFSGTLANNEAFAAQSAQSGTLNVSGAYGAGNSYTATGGLSTTPGSGMPVVNIQSQYVLTQIGTFSPSFDKDVFAGVTGTGVGIKQAFGDPTHSLQMAIVSGDHATTNPFEIEALSYAFPLLGNPFELTGGFEQVTGPAQTGQVFLRNGQFLGGGLVGKPPGTSFTYELHYGLVNYLDALTDTQRTNGVVDLAFGFMLRKAQFSFGYVRAGADFANLSAPSVKPDNEAETASVSVPLGIIQALFSANGYHDALPGSALLQQTHFWTESASLTYPLQNNDSLVLQSTNGIQHQTGNPIAPFSGNDNTSLAYTTNRGPYALQFTLASTNQRDNSNTLMHVISDAVTVSRAPFAGVTLTAGYNLTINDANVPSSTGLNSSATASATIVRGPFSFATQVSHSFAHPFVGLTSPPTTTFNYGLTFKPGQSPYSLSATLTENMGMISTSSGALNLNFQF